MVSLYWILLPELYFRLELHTDFHLMLLRYYLIIIKTIPYQQH